MTEDDNHLALEAERLRSDRPFAEAVIAIRKDALEQLATLSPVTQAEQIIALQAQIRAIDSLCGEIAAQILRGTPQKPRSVA